MAKFSTTITWSSGDQVTSTKLNEIVGGLEPGSDLVVGGTLVVVGGQLKVGIITANEMGSLSISNGSIQDNAVNTRTISDGSVTNSKLGNLSVTVDKIFDQSITLGKLSSSVYANKSTMESQSGGVLVDAANARYAPSSVKGYGEFTITNTTRPLRSNSYNVTGITRIDSTHSSVQLATNMISDTYTVVASFFSTGSSGENFACSVYDKAAGSFKIMHPAEGTGRGVNFAIFGRLNS